MLSYNFPKYLNNIFFYTKMVSCFQEYRLPLEKPGREAALPLGLLAVVLVLLLVYPLTGRL